MSRETDPIVNGKSCRQTPQRTPPSCHCPCRQRKIFSKATLAASLILLLTNLASGQQPSAPDVNAANNPLTPMITINFQDQAAPLLYGSDDGTNSFLFRGLIPHKLGGFPQLFRFTLPVATVPDGAGNTATGLGDLNVFDLFPFRAGKMEIAVGPQLTMPTATETATGTGKWQAGLATILIAPRKWGIAGVLLTWQHSFAGDDKRLTQDNLSFQPLIIYNLPKAWYLRSTATWTFDLARGNFAIPVGLGAGKVWILHSGTTVNLFAEPQVTVGHSGAGQPQFQLFAGLNLQFPIHRK
jgi:hypothetical protein